MEDKMRIGFLPSYRAYRAPFTEKIAVDMRIRVLKTFQTISREDHVEFIVPDETLTPKGLVRDNSDAEKVIELFKAKDIGGIIIGTMNFGDEISAATIAQRITTPVMLFSTKEGPFPEDGWGERSPAFCGTLGISSALYRRAIPFTFLGNCFPEEETFSRGVENFIKTCAAVKGFKGARIGLIGPRPESFETCAINEFPMIRQFSQQVVQASLADIFHSTEMLKGEEEVSRIVDEIKVRANCESVKEDTIRKAARLEIALKQFAQEKGLAGLGVQCWTAMQDIYGISPCLTLGRLTEQGIMTACEVDIHGTLTMLVQYLASLKKTVPHFIDWALEHQSIKNVFLAWHCGNGPAMLAMKGHPVYIRYNCILGPTLGIEKCEGTAEFQLKPGTVTLSRIVEYDGQFKMLITKGEIIPTKDRLRGTGGWVEVANLEKLYSTLANEGFTHHASLIHGDITLSLVEFCKFMGIKTILV